MKNSDQCNKVKMSVKCHNHSSDLERCLWAYNYNHITLFLLIPRQFICYQRKSDLVQLIRTSKILQEEIGLHYEKLPECLTGSVMKSSVWPVFKDSVRPVFERKKLSAMEGLWRILKFPSFLTGKRGIFPIVSWILKNLRFCLDFRNPVHWARTITKIYAWWESGWEFIAQF